MTVRSTGKQILIDLRRTKGRIWNQDDLPTIDLNTETDLDYLIYSGFRQHGADFVRQIRGKFGSVYHDVARSIVMICRDWVGEIPFHYYLADDEIIVANFITDIKQYLGPQRFRYSFVRAVPQSTILIIDCGHQYIYGNYVRKTWHIIDRILYYNFADDPMGCWTKDTDQTLNRAAIRVRLALEHSIRQRLTGVPSSLRPAVLLSGGIDSLTIAYLLSRLEPKAIAYTLSVDQGGEDVRRARQIAAKFGLEFRLVKVNQNDLVANYNDAIASCELYHLPNVYCALGMKAIAAALKSDGIETAFCGEGVNEAVGDYHDWSVIHPVSGEMILLHSASTTCVSVKLQVELAMYGENRDMKADTIFS